MKSALMVASCSIARRPRQEREAPPAPGAPPPVPSLFLVETDRNPPPAGQGRLNVALRMYLDPKQEFKQIFNEGWRNERDYLYVPNMHGADWPKMREMYGQLLPYVNHRADLNYLLDMMGAEIAIGHSYVRGGDMPAGAGGAGRTVGRRLRNREWALQGEQGFMTTRVGTRICAHHWPRPAQTSLSATTYSRSTAWS